MRTFASVSILALVSLLAACGGYRSIAPGMSTAEVNKEMSGYPVDKIVPFNDGYSASYYANDTCILFKDGVVVAKDQSEQHQNGISMAGVRAGGVETCHALCLPPGMSGSRVCDMNVYMGGTGLR